MQIYKFTFFACLPAFSPAPRILCESHLSKTVVQQKSPSQMTTAFSSSLHAAEEAKQLNSARNTDTQELAYGISTASALHIPRFVLRNGKN